MRRRVLLSLLSLLLLAGASTAQPTFKLLTSDTDAAKNPAQIPEWRDDDPPRQAPSVTATPGKVYAWKTAEGLRYAWSLPFDFEAGKAFNVVVILPPAGMDFRWGFASHKREPESQGGFRPGDLVISIDGPFFDPRRGPGGSRWFDINPRTIYRFRDVMLELSRELPVKHLYLYGSGGIDVASTTRFEHVRSDEPPPEASPLPDAPDEPPSPRPSDKHLLCGGGAFVTAFSAAFPALGDGIVVHSSGIIPKAAVNSSVPIVFLHGAKDAIHPLSEAVDAREAYAKAKHPCARLRVMRAFNDFPNPVRDSETLDFLDGLRTDDAAELVACAQRLLTPKPADEFDYTAPVWYAGAYEILSRLTAPARPNDDQASPADFPPPPDITDNQRAQARAWQNAIDAEAKVHAQAIAKLLATDDLRTLPLDGGSWLGYLLAYREDFRGVPACEAFARSISFDAVYQEHAAIAKELLESWQEHSGAPEAGDRYRGAIERLPHCFLYEALPVELVGYLRACARKAGELQLTADEKDRFEFATLWDTGWREGLDAYAARWRSWDAPKVIDPPKPKDDE